MMGLRYELHLCLRLCFAFSYSLHLNLYFLDSLKFESYLNFIYCVFLQTVLYVFKKGLRNELYL